MRVNKFEYLHVIQGHYGFGWEDVTFENNEKDARQMLKDYRLNQPEYPHRRIKRRELNPAFVVGE